MRILLFILLIVNIYASQIDEILKNVPKNSPSYSLDLILAEKIKKLKFIPPAFNPEIKNADEALKAFYTLADMKKEYIILPSEIKELDNKIAVLQNSEELAFKLQKIYYEKLSDIYRQKMIFYENSFSLFEKTFLKKIKNVNFNIQNAVKNTVYWNKLLTEKKRN